MGKFFSSSSDSINFPLEPKKNISPSIIVFARNFALLILISKLDGYLLPGLDPKGVPRHLKGTVIPFHYNDPNELRKIVQENELHIIWDGKTNKEVLVSPGIYFISININGLLSHQPIIKR